jgi:hypothetical protein
LPEMTENGLRADRYSGNPAKSLTFYPRL